MAQQIGREIAPFIVEDRRMLSRVAGDRIRITHIIQPGVREPGCITCCHAPDACACPTVAYCCPCVDYPGYIVHRINSSRYIFLRENGIEYNNPWMQSAKGNCCGFSCCELAVMDDVTVIYFDDIQFDDVKNSTRRCNDCKTFCCGGRGERVEIESRFCLGMCKRGRGSCACIPSCCPACLCPCFVKAELWVDDAMTAVETIKMARDSARERMSI